MQLTLEWLPGRYAVCLLPPDAPLPDWAMEAAGLVSITRTDEELSLVAPEERVGPEITAERGFVALRVVGPLDFSTVGVLASLTSALRDAGVPLLAISTYRTDILLVREDDAQRAHAALERIAAIDAPAI